MTESARATTAASAGKYAPIDGLQLYYEDHGSGRSLVLLHGGLLTIESTFGPLVPELAKSHRVIGIELQGHGHTADTDRPLTLANLADDVGGLLRHLGIEQADFFGFSLGGLVALVLVQRHSDLVGKLVIASVDHRPGGDDDRPEEMAEDDPRMPTPADFQMMEDDYRQVAPDPDHFNDFAAKASDMVQALQGWSDDDIRAIGAPTLLLVGDTDFVPLRHAVEMMELLPNGQLAVLPGTTHMGVTRSPDRVLALLHPFLDNSS